MNLTSLRGGLRRIARGALAAIAVLAPSLALALAPETDLPRVGYHPGGISYFGASYFADGVAMATNGWREVQADNSQISLDVLSDQFNADGYPKYLNSGRHLIIHPGSNTGYFNRPASWPQRNSAWAGKVVLTWKGNADIRVTNAASQIAGTTSGSVVDGRREYRLSATPNGAQIRIYSINTPITDLKLWLPDPADPQNQSLENWAFHPLFLDRLLESNWGYIRMMDWNVTNANPQINWSDRRRPRHVFQTGLLNRRNPAPGAVNFQGNPYAGDRDTGVAYERQIALANATNLDLWLNVPHLASDTYIDNLVLLLRYGSDANGTPYTSAVSNPVHPPLNWARKVYVEYSNEIWSNGNAFPQGDWAQVQANAQGITRAQFNARRFSHVWQRFETVLGTSRVVRVAAAFTGNANYTGAYLDEFYNNSSLLKPELLAVTTYFGNGIQNWINDQGWVAGRLASDSYWTSAQFAAHQDQAIDKWIDYLLRGAGYGGSTGFDAVSQYGGIGTAVRDLALARNLPLVAYEGGPSIYTDHLDKGPQDDDGITIFMEALNRNPRFAEAYRIHLEQARSLGLWAHMMFVDYSNWGKYGQWGHMEFLGATGAHARKYDFLRSWMAEHASIRNTTTPQGGVPSWTTPDALPLAYVGQAYSQTLGHTGGNGTRTVNIIASQLPSGLTLNTGSLTISGTPSTPGQAGYVFARVRDGDGDAAWRIFRLSTLRPAGTPFTVNFENLALGSQGNSFATQGFTLNDTNANRALDILGTADGYASKVVHPSAWGSQVRLRSTDGTPFRLVSLGYGTGRYGGTADFVVRATRVDGSVTTTTLATTSTKTLATLPAGFDGLSEIVIDWGAGVNAVYGAIDDIVVARHDSTGGGGGGGNPVTVNFESLPVGSQGNSVTLSGYTFAETRAAQVLNVWGTAEGYASKVLHASNWDCVVRITKSGGGAFGLVSLDYAGTRHGGASDAVITGTRSNGSTVTANISASNRTLQTLTLNWSDLVQVDIDYRGGVNNAFGAIDNVVFAP